MQTLYCGNCGKPLPPDALFCGECGIQPSISVQSERGLSRHAIMIGIGIAAFAAGGGAVMGASIFTYSTHRGRVWTEAWSPDSRRIASGSEDQTVRVWQAR